MKKSAWLFVSVLIAFVACKDDEEEVPNAISSEEAAVMVSSSFASNSSGISFVSKEAADESEDILEDNSGGRVASCGISQNIDLSGSSPSGGIISWSYNFSYKFRLNCNTEEAPENITADLSYSGDYSDANVAFEHSGLADLDLTGLDEASNDFLLNGLFKRGGSFEIKKGERKAGSSNAEITITGVTIDKTSHKISSGSASFVLTGSVSGKGTFKYTGTVIFKGNDSAELKISSEVFVVNLNNGDVAKK